MNKVLLKGRLVKDTTCTYTQGENSIAIYRNTIAVDRKPNKDGKRECDFINFKAFQGTAEFVSKYFVKGSEIIIVGRWETGSYDNKDGNKVFTNEMVVEEVHFCGSKNNGNTTSTDDTDDTTSLEDDLPF